MRNPLIANTPAADYINALALMETVCITIRNHEILKVVLNTFLWK